MSFTLQSSDGETVLGLESTLKLLPTTCLDSIWSSWATQLDRSDVMYVLLDEYKILAKATGYTIPYVEATCGSIDMLFIGRKSLQEGTPLQFWHENFQGVDDVKTQFAQILNEDLRDPKMAAHWRQSFKESVSYFGVHRWLVRNIGNLLGVDMDDHDLTKTTLVLYALGYLWHWPAEKPDDNDIRKDAAWKVVTECHLTQEDHHPEFHGSQVDASKLFCDRLAVHLQKDVSDGVGGWNVNEKWLPTELIPQWRAFREKHCHINLQQVSLLDYE